MSSCNGKFLGTYLFYGKNKVSFDSHSSHRTAQAVMFCLKTWEVSREIVRILDWAEGVSSAI